MEFEDKKNLVLSMRLEGKTLREIGDMLGVSRQRVHQCIVKYDHKYKKTAGEIIVQRKDYADYLKASSYKESYKRFCIRYYKNWLEAESEGRGIGGLHKSS